MDLTWFNGNKTAVFIDNSSFVNMSFNLAHPTFSTLKRAVDSNDIEIIVTEISKGEFIKHAELEIRDEEEKVKKISATKIFCKDLVDSLAQKCKEVNAISLWDKFTRDFKTRDISCNVNWKEVFSQYFTRKPPFSDKKKYEFADAFNIKMIESFNPDKVIIISNDNDFDAWAKDRGDVSLFKKMNEFANSYLRIRFKDEALSKAAFAALESLQGSIVSDLKDKYCDDFHYQDNIISDESEVTYANVKELSLIESELSATDEDEEFAVFALRFRGQTSIELSCPVKVWDSIDKEYMYHGTNNKSADIDIEIAATVTVFVNMDDPKNSDFDISDDEINPEEFEVPHEWTSFLDYDEDDL